MKKSLLLVLFCILGLSVVVVLILLLNSNTKVDKNIQISNFDSAKEIISQRVIEQKKSYGWTSKITPTDEKEYLYPVTELHIKLN